MKDQILKWMVITLWTLSILFFIGLIIHKITTETDDYEFLTIVLGMVSFVLPLILYLERLLFARREAHQAIIDSVLNLKREVVDDKHDLLLKDIKQLDLVVYTLIKLDTDDEKQFMEMCMLFYELERTYHTLKNSMLMGDAKRYYHEINHWLSLESANIFFYCWISDENGIALKTSTYSETFRKYVHRFYVKADMVLDIALKNNRSK